MKMKADEDMDVLEFKIINPKGKEKWADDCDISEVVEIYINGSEIVEFIKELEIPLIIGIGNTIFPINLVEKNMKKL